MLRGVAAGALAAVTGAKLGVGEVQAACGTGNQPCCQPGNTCEGQLQCFDGTCRDCGSEGEHCCQPSDTCDADLTCVQLAEGKRCKNNCGGNTEQCCAGNTCGVGFICVGGQCVPCGANTQPCCVGPTCNAGLICDNGTCGPTPPQCGANTQPCCPGNTCSGGLVCLNNTCQPCGAQSQVCCPGNVCNAGLTCTNGTCQPTGGGGGGGGGTGGGGATSTPCTSNAQCPAAAPFCDTATGTCFSVRGLNCKSGESPQQCCNRSVKKGCKRKQQTGHARQNCLKKGKKRCKQLLAGIA